MHYAVIDVKFNDEIVQYTVFAIRTEMMLSEFKKNAALQEFTELSNELQKGRKLQAVLHKDAEKIAERSSSAGLTTEEVLILSHEYHLILFTNITRDCNSKHRFFVIPPY